MEAPQLGTSNLRTHRMLLMTTDRRMSTLLTQHNIILIRKFSVFHYHSFLTLFIGALCAGYYTVGSHDGVPHLVGVP